MGASTSASSKKLSTAAKKVQSAVAMCATGSASWKKSSTAARKVQSAVAMGASASASSKKSPSHPQTNTEERVAKSSNKKKSNKSKQKEDNNETSEFLSLVSREKNAEVSPAAKEVF